MYTPLYSPRNAIVMVALPPEQSIPSAGYYGYGGVVGLYVPEDDRFLLFGHLSQVLRHRGEVVNAGDVIARTGNTSGNPPRFPVVDRTGRPILPLRTRVPPHLHAEARHLYNGRIPFPAPYGRSTESFERYMAGLGVIYGRGPGSTRIIPGSPADSGMWYRLPEPAPSQPPSIQTVAQLYSPAGRSRS